MASQGYLQDRARATTNIRTVRNRMGRPRLHLSAYRETKRDDDSNRPSTDIKKTNRKKKSSGEASRRTTSRTEQENRRTEKQSAGDKTTISKETQRMIIKALQVHERVSAAATATTVFHSLFKTAVSFTLIFWAVLLLFIARMSFERLGSPQKRRRDEKEPEQRQIGASERLTDT
jgi:hypothetical protein